MQPSILPNRKNKYERYAREGSHALTLTCIKDASTQVQHDDGPFDDPNKPSKPRRAQLLAMLRKTDGENPIFVFDGTKADLPEHFRRGVWDQSIGRHVDIPLMTPHLREVMAAYMQVRDQNMQSGKVLMEAEKRKAEAAAQASAQMMAGAIASALAEKFTPPDAAPAKKNRNSSGET